MEARSSDRTPAPHCADHAHFVAACSVCQRAQANVLPYPLRETKPLPRAFGFKDNITAATFREPGRNRYDTIRYDTIDSADYNEPSLSLLAIRFLLRLLWPFSRIL